MAFDNDFSGVFDEYDYTSGSESSGNYYVGATTSKRSKMISSVSRSMYIKKEGKNGNRNRKAMIPRILNRDIRLLYSSMFTNIANMADFSMFAGFFGEYCLPNLSSSYTMSPTVSQQMLAKRPHSPREINIVDSDMAAKFMFNNSQIMIDSIFQTTQACIMHQGNSEESKVVMSFIKCGTKIHDTSKWQSLVVYDDSPNVKAYHCCATQLLKNATNNWENCNNSDVGDTTSVDSNESTDFTQFISHNSLQNDDSYLSSLDTVNIMCTSQSGRSGYIRQYSPDQHMELLSLSPLLKNPVRIQAEGSITMHLNSEKKITRFELTNMKVDVDVKCCGLENTWVRC